MTGKAEQRDSIGRIIKVEASGMILIEPVEGKNPVASGDVLVLTTEEGVQVHVVAESVARVELGTIVWPKPLIFIGSVQRVVSEVSHA